MCPWSHVRVVVGLVYMVKIDIALVDANLAVSGISVHVHGILFKPATHTTSMHIN